MDNTVTLIGAATVCDAAGISRPTLTRDISAGRIKPYGKLSGRNGAFVFTQAEVDRYVTDRKRETR